MSVRISHTALINTCLKNVLNCEIVPFCAQLDSNRTPLHHDETYSVAVSGLIRTIKRRLSNLAGSSTAEVRFRAALR